MGLKHCFECAKDISASNWSRHLKKHDLDSVHGSNDSGTADSIETESITSSISNSSNETDGDTSEDWVSDKSVDNSSDDDSSTVDARSGDSTDSSDDESDDSVDRSKAKELKRRKSWKQNYRAKKRRLNVYLDDEGQDSHKMWFDCPDEHDKRFFVSTAIMDLKDQNGELYDNVTKLDSFMREQFPSYKDHEPSSSESETDSEEEEEDIA